MPTMKTLIIDDERLARQRLARQLSEEPDVELIGQCQSARHVAELLARGAANLLFVDVEMPRASGIELAKTIDVKGGREAPAIIFVTAHEQYAVQAFEVRACDYLLKPVADARLKVAVERARQLLFCRKDVEPREPRHLPAIAHPSEPLDDPGEERAGAVLVRVADRVLRIKLESIDWVEAAGNYVQLHVGGRSHLLRETIAAFEARLPRARFARIHRAAIANLDRVVEFQPLLSGDFRVILQGGTQLKMSRTYRGKIRDLFGRSI